MPPTANTPSEPLRSSRHSPQNLLPGNPTGQTDGQHLLDVGGASGTWTLAFLRAVPECKATIFDLPTTQPFAEATLQRFALADRIDFAAGDFLAGPLPGGFDVAWLSHVLHGEGPAGCSTLLANAFAALEPGGWFLSKTVCLGGGAGLMLRPVILAMQLLGKAPALAYVSRADLQRAITRAGFEIVETGDYPRRPPMHFIAARRL